MYTYFDIDFDIYIMYILHVSNDSYIMDVYVYMYIYIYMYGYIDGYIN